MAPRPGTLGSSVLAPDGATVIKDYQQPPSSPRALAPAPSPAAGSSMSAAPLPGSLAPPPQELTDSVVHLGEQKPPETGASTPRLPTEDRSPSSSPAASPTGSVLTSSVQSHSLDSPDKPKDKDKASPPAAQPPVSSPPLRSGSLPTPTPGGEDAAADAYSLAYQAAGKAYKITQHFVIRSPHVFIAITATFLSFKYLNDEPFAWEAATYVGVASAVYCIIRPLFLMIIPYSLLPRKTHDFWRHAINATNTIFITISLTSAIWGLKISSVQGTAIWGASFVLPYKLLSKHYPDLDGQFPNSVIRA